MSSTASRHRRQTPLRQILAIGAFLMFVGTVILAGLTGLQTTILAILTLIAVFNLTLSSSEVYWRMYSHRTPEAKAAMGFPEPTTATESGIKFGLILAALDEPAVIGDTMRGLAAINYDASTTYVTLRGRDTITGSNTDPQTVAVATETVARLTSGSTELVVRDYDQRTERGKAYQLNTAYKHIRSTNPDVNVVGVFDAEDDVHPDLLAHVAAEFKDHPEVDIIQAGVQLMNLDLDTTGAGWLQKHLIHLKGWFCAHNVLEYYAWFSSRMYFQVKQGVVPLGGNTVFIRTSLLDKTQGWPTTLTEDASLGIRASALHGATVRAIYDPRFVTKEETPHSLREHGSQRERWDTGFGNEFLEGYWRRLKTRWKRTMAAYVLATPFLQAFSGIMLPISIAITAFDLIRGPVALVLFMYTPLVPLSMTVVQQIIMLREFAQLFDKKLHLRHYLSLVIGFFPYQLRLAYAALRSIRKIAAGHNDWFLTSHQGLHRTPETPSPDCANVSSAARIATEEGVA